MIDLILSVIHTQQGDMINLGCVMKTKKYFEIMANPNFGVYIHKLQEKCLFNFLKIDLPAGEGPRRGYPTKMKYGL